MCLINTRINVMRVQLDVLMLLFIMRRVRMHDMRIWRLKKLLSPFKSILIHIYYSNLSNLSILSLKFASSLSLPLLSHTHALTQFLMCECRDSSERPFYFIKPLKTFSWSFYSQKSFRNPRICSIEARSLLFM